MLDTDEDRLETTPVFLENNVKIEYSPKLKDKLWLSFNGGIQNVMNSYQKDFDEGPNRDSGYIYGPGRPRTFFFGVSVRL